MAIRYNYNSVYRDQIARRISAATSGSNGWNDVLAAEAALEWLITYFKTLLGECLQTTETGVCDLTWKHEHCAVYMSVLYDLTKDDKYMPVWEW